MSYYLQNIFKNPKTVITTHTSSQASSDTANAMLTLTGSEVTYTPSSDSTKVIYEISFYAEKINGITFQGAYLQRYDTGSSSWVEINERYRRNFGNSGTSGQAYRYYFHWRFVLPTWTGSRQLRIILGSNASNRNILMNQMTEWDGSSASSKFCNTNLLVYSI